MAPAKKKMVPVAFKIGPTTYRAALPEAEVGSGAVDGRAFGKFEKAVMRALCTHGVPSGEGLKFLRQRSRLSASEFAELVGADESIVSRWENDVHKVPPASWELMVLIAEDHLKGRTDTVDRIRERLKRRAAVKKEEVLTVEA
jgi:DNA-binding transcriptional regulator YiaG